ncbi:MAG: hypothetical protein AAGB03_06060 [Pseudomonadota bacterium]
MGKPIYWLLWKPLFHFGRPALFIVSAAAFVVAAYGLIKSHARAYPDAVPTASEVEENVRGALASVKPFWAQAHPFWLRQVSRALDDQDLPMAEAYLAAATDLVPAPRLIEQVRASEPEAFAGLSDLNSDDETIESLLSYSRDNLVTVRDEIDFKFVTIHADPPEIIFLPPERRRQYLEAKHGLTAWAKRAELCGKAVFDGKFDTDHPITLQCILASDVLTPWGDARDMVVYGCAEASHHGLTVPGCDLVRVADEGVVWRRVILAASTVGLVMTGYGIAGDAQAALIKSAAKSGRMSRGLAKAIMRSADEAVPPRAVINGLEEVADASRLVARPGRYVDEVADVAKQASRSSKFGRFVEVFFDFRALGKNVGSSSSALRVVNVADSMADLKALNRVAKAAGPKTLILHKRFGRLVLRAGFVATPKYYARVQSFRAQLWLSVVGLMAAAGLGAIEVVVKQGAKRRGAFRWVDGRVRHTLVR